MWIHTVQSPQDPFLGGQTAKTQMWECVQSRMVRQNLCLAGSICSQENTLAGDWYPPQSTHRVVIANFWRTSHHDGKISPGWWEWGVHAHPLSTYDHHVRSCSVYAPAERQIHSLYFTISSLPFKYSVYSSTDDQFSLYNLSVCPLVQYMQNLTNFYFFIRTFVPYWRSLLCA
jgi:hypothetical protein